MNYETMGHHVGNWSWSNAQGLQTGPFCLNICTDHTVLAKIVDYNPGAAALIILSVVAF